MDIDLDGKPKKELKEFSFHQRTTKLIGSLLAGAAAVTLLMAGLYFWQVGQMSRQLLPEAITAPIKTFTPYFYLDSIPHGYAVDKGNINLTANLLSVPLTKSGAPTIAVTEQPLAPQLSIDDIKKNATEVKGGPAVAYVNAVEGRLVGVMPVQSTKTMVLLNAPDSVSKDDFYDFIKSLHSLR